jgi:hypothetical protein
MRRGHGGGTETRWSVGTTELGFAVLIAGLVLLAGVLGDLGARDVWLYVSVLTAGYLVSRGLAKSRGPGPRGDR